MSERANDPGTDLPEVQKFTEGKVEIRKANRRIVRNITFVAVLTGAGVISSAWYYGATNRATLLCEARSTNAIAHDVAHLLERDRNLDHYPIPKQCK